MSMENICSSTGCTCNAQVGLKLCEYHVSYNKLKCKITYAKNKNKNTKDLFDQRKKLKDDFNAQKASLLITAERSTTVAVTDSETATSTHTLTVEPSVTTIKRKIHHLDGTTTEENEERRSEKRSEEIKESFEKKQRREIQESTKRTAEALLTQSVDVLIIRTEMIEIYKDLPIQHMKVTSLGNGKYSNVRIVTPDKKLGTMQDEPRMLTRSHQDRAFSTIAAMIENTANVDDPNESLNPRKAGLNFSKWINGFNPCDVAIWPLMRYVYDMFEWEISAKVMAETKLMRSQPLMLLATPDVFVWSVTNRVSIDKYRVSYDFTRVPGLVEMYNAAIEDAKAAGVPDNKGYQKAYGLWPLKGECTVAMSPGMAACYAQLYNENLDEEAKKEATGKFASLMNGTAYTLGNTVVKPSLTQQELRDKYYYL